MILTRSLTLFIEWPTLRTILADHVLWDLLLVPLVVLQVL